LSGSATDVVVRQFDLQLLLNQELLAHTFNGTEALLIENLEDTCVAIGTLNRADTANAGAASREAWMLNQTRGDELPAPEESSGRVVARGINDTKTSN
jgi:hypothetical protein